MAALVCSPASPMDETTLVRNEADALRRAKERLNQHQNSLSQRRKSRINSRIEVNIMELTIVNLCIGHFSVVCPPLGVLFLYWRIFLERCIAGLALEA
ncbi:hypothetical protein AVEN_81791-1 [Araneus ventricosus]|uniref:Uncharacterized protein n=1 Tax=Araneus ventricosus TaxID=182803 RepID=A0A4Y2L8X2_ARAVE|nr:hypothetical protein AVEN_81791-1 [Araneus ventricosus]